MSKAYETIFAHSLDLLRAQYKTQGKEAESALWLNVCYSGDDGDTIMVGVQNAFMWRMMTDKGIVAELAKTLSQLAGHDIKLSPSFMGGASPAASIASYEHTMEDSFAALHSEASGEHSSSQTGAIQGEGQVQRMSHPDGAGDIKLSQAGGEQKGRLEEYTDASKTAAGQSGGMQGGAQTAVHHPTLIPRYTFDSFVTGENSDYAYNVCMAAARAPGTKFNPILLYGGVGLGKTHLMEAIGNYIWQDRGGKVKIVCVSAEKFGEDFTTSLNAPRQSKAKAIEKFKDKYRGCDVLLLDDIHFLQGKSGMQDELFYTFNALRDKNRQLVFTCDRPISHLKKIVDRLASRLSNGQCVDLRAPSYEVRRAILQKKLDEKGVAVSSAVIDYIAASVETNVRDLESALGKVIGYAEMTNKTVTPDLAQYLLRDMKAVRPGGITIDDIQKIVAEDYNVTVAELKGKKRDKRLAYPRQVACYLCRELTEAAFSDIGHEFGGRDHATIMHACDVIATDRKLDNDVDDRLTRLIELIRHQ